MSEETKAPIPEFKMPPIKVGDTVLHWIQKGLAEPVPLIVTRVGERGLSGLAFPPGVKGGIHFDGVRHRSDPVLTKDNTSGAWDYTDLHKAVLKLLSSREAFGKPPEKK